MRRATRRGDVAGIRGCQRKIEALNKATGGRAVVRCVPARTRPASPSHPLAPARHASNIQPEVEERPTELVDGRVLPGGEGKIKGTSRLCSADITVKMKRAGQQVTW
jgi:hypothetical protein